MPKSTTIEERIASAGGVTSGWDYLRIFLAMSVVAIHSALTSYGIGAAEQMWRSPFRAPAVAVLPMFFALSGFLVSGSLERAKALWEFVLLRALRIVPALLVEILLSAFILGPLLTAVPLSSYFSGVEFRSYFLNVIGWVHYYLPGVFNRLPYADVVNGSLWTIPFELECYASLIILAVVGLMKRRVLFTAVVTLANVALAVQFFLQFSDAYGERSPGRLLVLSFLAGVSIFLWRDRVKLNALLFIASSVLSLALLTSPKIEFLAAFPVAYSTVYLGLTRPPKNWFLMTGDYSYGLYLFAFPIQQTFTLLFPAYRYWWANIAFTLVIGLAYAFFSWHVVEKRVLSKRKILIANGHRLLSRRQNPAPALEPETFITTQSIRAGQHER